MDITKIATFRSAKASVFGVMLGMSKKSALALLQQEQSLTHLENDDVGLWWFIRRRDCKQVMMLSWEKGDSLLWIELLPEFGEYLQGDSKRLVTVEAADLHSELVRGYLGSPNKVVDETGPVLDNNGIKWTTFRHCYFEKGIECHVYHAPARGQTVHLRLVR
jgi:hypothetical protein